MLTALLGALLLLASTTTSDAAAAVSAAVCPDVSAQAVPPLCI
jgi:hypothetical protein